ncbi:FAD/NAD(P)-binding domain-containing protein [Aspergillus sclerotiicarbonarius CBS 121057]|uniref:FAD/NAD(P)-binding domain-containing protein n=1 Tax=Aspergillus sclerotiicarbonarius (strain CBS 121057 / IBT 28362) TaxID=1448318 RepID=A0A319EN39_ASPSB|nr:FAD/NAD(P)-binding domain-containing protein [Aspergillus sclerotiicarbonarius CBS 121057]
MAFSESKIAFNEVIIIGAGFSGLAMACQLKRKLGCDDFSVFDRASGYGGAWHANQYPGCGVDIPAALYSLSFAPKTDFSCFFPKQDEILHYINSVVKDHQLMSHFTGHTEWVGASWQESSKTWHVTLKDLHTGQEFLRECRILVSAVGALSMPDKSSIPGAERFTGDVIHTANWDRTVSLRDKRVVVIGNGASATQIIPAIAKEAGEITQFIRTPQLYLPGQNTTIGSLWQNAYKYVPGLLVLVRIVIFLYLETATLQFRRNKTGANMRDQQFLVSRRYILDNAPEKYWSLLIPTTEAGCKRRVFDNDGYIHCLNRDNVHLVQDPVVEINESAVLTRSGRVYPADVIILGTGFSLSHFDTRVIGCQGRTRAEHWKSLGGIKAFNTIAMSGFPNLFYVLGPNSGTGHTSTIYAIESYVDLIVRVIEPILRGKASSVQVKASSEQLYSKEIEQALQKTIYNNSCPSWFIDKKTGTNWAIYPWSSFWMWYTTRAAGLDDWVHEVGAPSCGI